MLKIDFKSSWLNPEKVRKIVIVGKKKMLLYNEIDFKNPIKIYNKYARHLVFMTTSTARKPPNMSDSGAASCVESWVMSVAV